MLPVAKYEDDGKPRKLPKKGYHNARLKIIADLGTVKATDPNYSDRRMMLFIWELVDLSNKKKTEWVQQQLPFNGKSKNLQAMLDKWLGILPAEMLRKDFEIASLLNEPAEISVIHSKDGKWANIAKDGVDPGNKKTKPGLMKPMCVTLFPDEFDMDEFKKLPNWIQNKMMNSDEFIEVSGERTGARRAAKNANARGNAKVKASPKKAAKKRGRK